MVNARLTFYVYSGCKSFKIKLFCSPKRFHDCLVNDYDFYSNLIWKTYETAHIQCFSYFPCNSHGHQEISDEQIANIWTTIAHVDMGECRNGSRLIIFRSLNDYLDFMRNELNENDRMRVKEYLTTGFPQKLTNCSFLYPNYTVEMAQNYEKYFLTSTHYSFDEKKFNKRKLDK
jgi:hypothetical protein